MQNINVTSFFYIFKVKHEWECAFLYMFGPEYQRYNIQKCFYSANIITWCMKLAFEPSHTKPVPMSLSCTTVPNSSSAQWENFHQVSQSHKDLGFSVSV